MKYFVIFQIAFMFAMNGYAQENNLRNVLLLDSNWKFINRDFPDAELPQTNVSKWETVEVPHDWAIKGPFDKEIDMQEVRVQQDMEQEARTRTGRTGALPHIGVGWYRKSFELPAFSKWLQLKHRIKKESCILK